MKVLKLSILTIVTLFFMSCTQKKSAAQKHEAIKTTAVETTTVAPVPGPSDYKKGDQVPAHLVCMVNDAYMGKMQLEVPFDGKMYYGCCEMCKERIPKDVTVRQARDPLTLKNVDKAKAYVVLIGDNGEVAYFENEKNYTAFKEQND